MRHPTLGRFAAALTGLALAIAGVVVPASPAAAAFTVCGYSVTRVTALNTLEPAGDEVYMLLGDQRFPTSGAVSMDTGDVAYSGAFGYPYLSSSLPATLQLWESDGLLPDDGLGFTTLPCVASDERAIPIIRTTTVEYLVWVRVLAFQV